MFCKKCGSIVSIKPGEQIKVCNSCGEGQNESIKLTESVKDKSKKIEIIDSAKEININAKTREECPKCGHGEAYFFTKQTRSSDEPETKFLKCVKCEKMWRDYS